MINNNPQWCPNLNLLCVANRQLLVFLRRFLVSSQERLLCVRVLVQFAFLCVLCVISAFSASCRSSLLELHSQDAENAEITERNAEK